MRRSCRCEGRGGACDSEAASHRQLLRRSARARMQRATRCVGGEGGQPSRPHLLHHDWRRVRAAHAAARRGRVEVRAARAARANGTARCAALR
eukprot:5345197-Prymnesium_polylepis.1